MTLDGDGYIPAVNGAQGPIDNRPAEIIVMHSMECPPDDQHVDNWVRSLASPQGGQYFAHYYTGPSVTYRVAPLGRTLWHCGNGNSVRGRWTLGVEQAGYAAQTRQEWIDSKALNTSAPLVAELIAAGHGANRWLEVADLLVDGARGVTSHNNMSRAFGGSDHTDPGDNYPHDLLLAPVVNRPDIVPPEVHPMIATTANADGRLEVFQGKLGGQVRHRWQTAPNAGWSAWVDMGPDVVAGRGLVAGRNADGRLELFAEDNDYTVRHCWQTAPNAGWSAWVTL